MALRNHYCATFALLDSASVFRVPKKSALQSAVGIDAATWQAIHGVLLQDAKQRDQVRIDSTVTETDILEPSDSRLLCGC